MKNLTPKDTVFNWESPVSAHRGKSNGDENLILLKRMSAEEHNTKWSSKLIDFKAYNLEKFFDNETNDFRMAISFDKDRIIVVFNPPKGIPFYRLTKNGNGRAINNVNLIERLYDFFQLDRTKSKYFLKIHYWAEVNEMKLYIITPYEYDTREPVFDNEKVPSLIES